MQGGKYLLLRQLQQYCNSQRILHAETHRKTLQEKKNEKSFSNKKPKDKTHSKRLLVISVVLYEHHQWQIKGHIYRCIRWSRWYFNIVWLSQKRESMTRKEQAKAMILLHLVHRSQDSQHSDTVGVRQRNTTVGGSWTCLCVNNY